MMEEACVDGRRSEYDHCCHALIIFGEEGIPSALQLLNICYLVLGLQI